MSITGTVPNKLTKTLKSYDNQVVINDEPLLMSAGGLLILGKPGTGKSTIALTLFSNKNSGWYKFFDHIFMISPTAKMDDKMSKIVEELSRDDKFFSKADDEVFESILTRLQSNIDRWVEKGRSKEDLHQCIFLDDCLASIKGRKMRSFEFFITALRHYKCWIVVTSQKFLGLPPIIRQCMSGIIMFATENQYEFKSIMQEVGADHEKFKKAYHFACDEAYSFMYVKINPICTYFKKFDRILFTTKNDADSEAKE